MGNGGDQRRQRDDQDGGDEEVWAAVGTGTGSGLALGPAYTQALSVELCHREKKSNQRLPATGSGNVWTSPCSPAAGTDLDPVTVVGLFGEVGAACVTGRDVLGSVRAADGVEGAAEAGAVGGAQRPAVWKDKCDSASADGGGGSAYPPSGTTSRASGRLVVLQWAGLSCPNRLLLVVLVQPRPWLNQLAGRKELSHNLSRRWAF